MTLLKDAKTKNTGGDIIRNSRITNIFDRKYLKSEKQAQWCKQVISTHDMWQQFIKEIIDIETITILQRRGSANELNENLEWRSIVDLEIVELESKIAKLQQEFNLLLADIYPFKHRDVFIEIRTLAGGDEASIWVSDLVRMYTRYAEQNKYWKVEIDLLDFEIGHFTPYGLCRSKVGNPYLGIGRSLFHQPSNTLTTCASSDRPHKNTEKALELISSKLYDLEIKKQLGEDVR